MHYFKFHGAPDEPPVPKEHWLFLRTADYLTYEMRRPGGTWEPFETRDAWSVGSRYATAEEAENA